MERKFLDLLVDPITQQPLLWDATQLELKSTTSGKHYPLYGQVAVILEPLLGSFLEPSLLHQQYGTHFDYQHHYEQDAVLFDYSEQPESQATIHENRRLHQAIFSIIRPRQHLLLDVGCGNGWAAQEALKKGLTIISMDVSRANPEKAIQQYPHEKHFGLVADAFQMPIKDAALDAIIASEIMEHVADPQKFVAALYEKLRPGGQLIITTPYNEKIEYYLCVHCNRPTPKHAHLHSFNEHNIQKLFPVGSTSRWEAFSNKYLAKLRTHVLLKHLPFGVWRAVDKLINRLIWQPTRLLMEITKPE
jgi:2-polyprenyl-3-methyl-5-hydroxy-6-metoxy-1,4-benzoquinol methylase/uncharacterized protein YbaR (Trm112 family)